MNSRNERRRSVCSMITVAVMAAAPAFAADGTATTQGNAATLADLQAQVQTLKNQISQLQKQEDQNWMSAERTAQIKTIVQEAMQDAKQHDQSGLNAGYNNGFFVQSGDKNFTAKLNGFIQYRYTYESATLENASAYGSKPPKNGDASGFDFRYLRLTADGNVFTPELTYVFTGDFASNGNDAAATSTGGVGTTSQTGDNFQLVDGYFAYRFNDMVNVRAGAFITPYSRVLYIAPGLQFVDFPNAFRPFNQDRGTGASLYGDLIKNTLTYEVNVNNGGKNDNQLGRAADSGASGEYDNRLSFATREAYYGSGSTPADFLDESDLRKDNSTLAWMIGVGAIYDSANTTSGAFPAAQAGESIVGVGTVDSPGFGSYPLNGDIYRGTVDASFKYRGLSLTAASFFEQINENPAVAGQTIGSPASSFPNGYSATSNSSFFVYSFYGQIGYMLNKQWEVAARVGTIGTEGSPNTSQEYAVGLNYYIFGKNVKLQSDVTFVPSEAAFTDTTFGSTANTQDLTVRLQLQVKF